MNDSGGGDDEGFGFYLFFVVRFGDARLWNDLACVDVARGQVRQLVHSGESSLQTHKNKRKCFRKKE